MLLVPCPTWVSVPTRSWEGVGDEGAGRGLLLKMIYGSRSDQGIRDKSEQKIPIAGRRARLRVGENTSVVPQGKTTKAREGGRGSAKCSSSLARLGSQTRG